MNNQIYFFSELIQNKFQEVLKNKSCNLHLHSYNMSNFCYLVDQSLSGSNTDYLLYK